MERYAVRNNFMEYVFRLHTVNPWTIPEVSNYKMRLFKKQDAETVAEELNAKPGQGPFSIVEMFPVEEKRFGWEEKIQTGAGFRYAIYNPANRMFMGINYVGVKSIGYAKLYTSVKTARKATMGMFGDPNSLRLRFEDGQFKLVSLPPVDELFSGLQIVKCVMKERESV